MVHEEDRAAVNSSRPYKPGPSKIHGLGVIATRLIRAGERVNVNLGAEFYGFNHSCRPNLGRAYGATSRIYASYRFALRAIDENEELTVDYRAWGRPTFICNCPTCRKETV